MRNRTLHTVFFGGGTPSILPVDLLCTLLKKSRAELPFAAGELEISIEVNPATIGLAGLRELRRGGFNRLSIGIQSLADSELQLLGRPHTAADALQVLREARQAGFANLSCDLMFGLPGQTPASWNATLEKALAAQPVHCSIYELTLEEGTPFARRFSEGKLSLPDEEEVLEMMAITDRLCREAGLLRYEISNYALPGRECRHNINYWQNGSYVGLGPGAVSCLSGRRLTAVNDVARFCQRIEEGEAIWDDEEHLDNEARFRETVIMGLRMITGVSLVHLEERFGVHALDYYGETLTRLLAGEFLTINEGFLQLTEKGMTVANAVMADLV